ncbi:MAG: cupin domain-containing protein [Bacteriovoracia bacterium]
MKIRLAFFSYLVFSTLCFGRAHIVSKKEAPTYKILNEKGEATLLLNEATGSKELSLSALTLKPGAVVPEHIHETSVEVLYALEGALELTVEGKKFVVKKGDAAYIPQGAKHSARVAGKKPFAATQVYVGPGPEQRFKPKK